jgi:hypothetical protein
LRFFADAGVARIDRGHVEPPFSRDSIRRVC